MFQVILLSFHRFHRTVCLASRTHLLTFHQGKRLSDAAILSLLTALHFVHANMGWLCLCLLHFHLADARQQRTTGPQIPSLDLLGRWLLQLFENISIWSQKYVYFVCLQLEGWELWSFHFVHLVHLNNNYK
jgi:hypothetical protein